VKKVTQTRQFSRDVKRLKRQGKNPRALQEVINLLAQGVPLAAKYHDHVLIGRWRNARDCHIEGDWILIYRDERDSIRLERTGTHSDLFGR